MKLEEFLEHVNDGKTIHYPSEAQELCDDLLLEATRIKMKLRKRVHQLQLHNAGPGRSVYR